MADKALPPCERLHQLFHVDFETGTLIWKRRPERDFASHGDFLTWNIRFAGKPAFATVDGQGYLHGRIGSFRPKTHAVIWCMKHGRWPKQIDHINGNRADNRLENLREVTAVQNNRNRARPFTNTSGVMGVAFRKDSGRWRAFINANGRRANLGTFDLFDEAVAARKMAERTEGYHQNHGR